MLILNVHHTEVILEGAELYEKLYKLLHFKEVNPYIPMGYKYHSVFDKKNQSFPTGYLTKFTQKLIKAEIQHEIRDLRTYSTGTAKLRMRGGRPDPRDWQEEAFNEIQAHPTGIIKAATGAGKSELIYRTIAAKNVLTLVITPLDGIRAGIEDDLVEIFGSPSVMKKIPEVPPQLWMNRQQDSGKPQTSIKIGYSGKQDAEGASAKSKTIKVASSYGSGSTGAKSLLSKISFGASYKDKEDKVESKFKKPFKQKKLPTYEEVQAKRQAFYEKQKAKIPKWYKDIIVINYQSIGLLPKEILPLIKMIIIDEGHTASVKSIRSLRRRAKNVEYCYGFTATPQRNFFFENELLLSSVGEQIYSYSAAQAWKDGAIAKPEYIVANSNAPEMFVKDRKAYVKWLSRATPEQIEQFPNYYRWLYVHGVVENENRNRQIVKQAMDETANDRNVFITVEEKRHIEILQQMFRDQGVEVNVITGDTSKRDRKKLIKTVGQTEGACITLGTMAVGMGVNMPEISSVIVAAAGKSPIKLLQRIGRGVRKTANKSRVFIYDYNDWFNDVLKKHARARVFAFKSEYGLDVHF